VKAQRSELGNAITGAFAELFKIQSEALSADRSVTQGAGTETALASDLRMALAVRSWVNPRELLPSALEEGIRTRTLNAVAPDVETSFVQYPGKWYLAVPVRRRIVAGADRDALRTELNHTRHAGDPDDPVRRAFRKLLDLEPLDLDHCSVDDLRAIENATDWLGDHYQEGARIRDEAVALGTRRKRESEIERMTAAKLIGRTDALENLKAFVTAPFRPIALLAATYICGVGGAGKSTVLAHVEKEAMEHSPPLILIHLDFDRTDLDPADPISLDLVLLEQLSVAVPQMAADCRALSEQLGEFRSRLRADKSDSVSRGRSDIRKAARRRRSFKVTKKAPHSIELESVDVRQSSERDSILYHRLASFGSQSGRPFVLILDTLEVVFARGASAMGDLAKWLDSLVKIAGATDVRAVLAGRDPLPEDSSRDIYTRLAQLGHEVRLPITLSNLTEDEAIDLLTDAGVKDESAARAAAKALPGNPLVLRIAAEIFSKSPESLEEVQSAHAAGRIDRLTASRYLAQRFVAHLPDPVARPYAIAAIALPQVTEELIREVILPVMDGANAVPDRRKAKRVYEALAAAGWLVVPSLDGKSFTYHTELRALVQKFIEADPDEDSRQRKVRAAAIDWYRNGYGPQDDGRPLRRSAQDRAFILYHRLMLGSTAIHPGEHELTPLLARFLGDLPEEARKALTEQQGADGAGRLHVAGRPTDAEWKAYVEGVGQRGGQGEKLVKRGRATEALNLYRERPTADKGVPPTFVIQALADGADWGTDEVDAESILKELQAALPGPGKRLSGALLSRVYWLTRYEMLRNPKALSTRHSELLRTVAKGLRPGSRLMAMPSLIATAEVLAGERMVPSSWVERMTRVIAADTRLYLVHALHFKEVFSTRAQLDAVVVTQKTWSARMKKSARDLTVIAPERIREVQRQLNSLQKAPYFEVSKVLRELRMPISIGHDEVAPASVILLLRGMTIEFHRPLATALAACHKETRARDTKASFQPLWRVIGGIQKAMTIRPRELDVLTLQELVASDAAEWFGAFVSYADRSRLLPVLCKRLARRAGKTPAQRRLQRVAAAFQAWDKALCNGGSSGW
jgi:hypothetical protein